MVGYAVLGFCIIYRWVGVRLPSANTCTKIPSTLSGVLCVLFAKGRPTWQYIHSSQTCLCPSINMYSCRCATYYGQLFSVGYESESEGRLAVPCATSDYTIVNGGVWSVAFVPVSSASFGQICPIEILLFR